MSEKKDKSRLIAEEIVKMIERGKADEALDSYPEFHEFLRKNEYAAELLDHLADVGAYRIPAADKDKEIRRLIMGLQRRKRRKKIVRIWIASTTAACIVIAAILLRPGAESTQPPLQANTVMQPALVKSNGETIWLNGGKESVDLVELAFHDDGFAAQEKGTSFEQIIVPPQNMLTIRFNDGSEITMNANSSMKYDSGFGTCNRNVELRGEAYFRVSRSDIPFRVMMGGSTVNVYGTEFNAEYREGASTGVVLVSGSVEFAVAGREIILSPGQFCFYSVPDGAISLSEVGVDEYTNWRNNEFNYKDIALTDLLRRLSDWYGVTFDYNPDELNGIGLYISSSRDAPLEELLEMIERSADVAFGRKDGIITINPKK